MAQVESQWEEPPMVRTRTQDGLRGPVKSYTESRTFPAVEGIRAELRSESTTKYDPAGRIAEERVQSDDRVFIAQYEYSPSGQLLKMSWGDERSPLTESSYSYDQKGRIQQITNQGWQRHPISFHYDEQGRKTSTQTFTPADYRPNIAIGISSFEVFADMPNLPAGGTTTSIFDEHDRLTEIQVRDAEGQLVRHAVRTFGPQGRPSEEKLVKDNIFAMLRPEVQEKALRESGVSPEQFRQEMQAGFMRLLGGGASYLVHYRYGSGGRLIHTSRTIYGHTDEIETTYNDRGDVESEFTRSTHPTRQPASTEPPRPPSYSETRYEYRYDQHGNWTEKASSYRATPDSAFQSSSSSKRTLNYY